MTTRLQLHRYIDSADDRKLETTLNYIKKELKIGNETAYDKWDDPEFLDMVTRRADALENGSDKGYTWEEVKERARSMKLEHINPSPSI